MPPERVQRSAVRDHEDSVTRVLPRNPLDGCEHAGEVILARLSVVVGRTGEAFLDLGSGEARPRADVDLPQARLANHRDAVGDGDDLRRLPRTPKIAGVE